jgi:hypothetical protein
MHQELASVAGYSAVRIAHFRLLNSELVTDNAHG